MTGPCLDPFADAEELRAIAIRQVGVTFEASTCWYPGIGRKPSQRPRVWCEPAYSDIEQTLFALHDQLDFDAAARLARRTGDAGVYLKDLTAKHNQDEHPGDEHPFGASVRAFRAESAHLTLRVIALSQWLEANWDAQTRQPTHSSRFPLDSYLRLLLVQHRQQRADSPNHIEAARRALAAEARALETDSHRLAAWAQVTASWLEDHTRRRIAWQLSADLADDHQVSEPAAA